ncbi:putative transcriptional regulator of 2-aminoethylphosphonate degradation [compost metagenome]
MPAEQSRHYLRIRDQLALEITEGALILKLPAERELAERFHCTRITLREALQQLETEGLVYRENRRGWFVSPPRILYNPTRTTGFMDYVTAQGREPRTETLQAERRPAGAWLARRMGLAETGEVFVVHRRRWVDQRPVMLEVIALDANWCPGLLELNLDTSLTDLLQKEFGLAPSRCRLAMHPTALERAQAEPLQLAPGSPALYLERQSFAEGERIVEFDQEFWRPDALEVVIEATYPDSVTKRN